MAEKPTIYFFHGLESGPHGRKYHRLTDDFDVVSPDFEGMMDIWNRLEKAERITRQMSDLVVVGSSFGGLLAALLYSRYPERFHGYVLMAPALRRGMVDEVEQMPENAVVIHGTRDEVIPIDEVREFCEPFGIEMIEVDDDHPLANSMEVMVESVNRVLNRQERGS